MCSLRLISVEQQSIDVLPKVGNASPDSCCFMFYDFKGLFSTEWLGMVESIFSKFEVEPSLAAGSIDQKHSSGNYRRIKKKLSSFLELSSKNSVLEIKIDAGVGLENNDFFACDSRVAFSVASYGLSMGVVAVDRNLVENVTELVDSISELVFDYTGCCYAHAFDFPSAYGPDYYLASVGAVPKGYSTLDNKAYVDRITRWRDNVWHEGMRPSDGYLREVYPINFVLQAHLEQKINGRNLSEYMKSVGNLIEVNRRPGLYRWDVDEASIHIVRDELEQSGLILSA